ncbi:MAG: hypothetical protein RL653_67 [Pseudomonadota bacterium]|jgi:hypothetical protein
MKANVDMKNQPVITRGRNPSPALFALGLVLLCGCKEFIRSTRFGVGLGTGKGLQAQQAVTSSVANRASGGCYAECRPGTRCVPATGLCEEIPATPAGDVFVFTGADGGVGAR